MRSETLNCMAGGERLDVFLAANAKGLTRNAAQKLIDAGNVTRGGAVLRKNHITAPGDEYLVIQNEPESPLAMPQDIRLDVVYEDEDVIVVNKPRGMVVHPAPGHPDGTLVNALLCHCGGSLSGIGGIRRPGIVHRIDKDTSGLVIAAKNDKAHIALAEQLSARTLKREYDAVVRGAMKNDSGTVNAPVGRHPTDRKRQAVFPENNGQNIARGGRSSRPAVTHYEVIRRYAGYTHIRCRLETGRTHQIRVHMAYIGHPVAGDMVYGPKKPGANLPGRYLNAGQCLHAGALTFIHPSSNGKIDLRAELPGYFTDILALLEKRVNA